MPAACPYGGHARLEQGAADLLAAGRRYVLYRFECATDGLPASVDDQPSVGKAESLSRTSAERSVPREAQASVARRRPSGMIGR